MSLRITPTAEPATFLVEGELDLATADELASVLTDQARRGAQVTLDLSGLTFIDSTGLAILLRTATSSGTTGPLVLLRPSKAVRRVFDLTLPHGAPGLEIRED
jgi:anti-anti-sigma factor